MEIVNSETQRGFACREFRDLFDNPCSLQKSSLATEDAIWFGVDDANPLIMASQAAELGIRTFETTGCVPYPIPKAVLLHTRMHLSREQVAELLPILQKFVETGEI